jgi:CRP/FNR family transcriptional regulator
MAPVDLVSILNRSYYFSGLSDEFLVDLIPGMHLRSCHAGEIVFFEGDACAGLHILQSGRIKLYKQARNGRELVLRNLLPGDSFDEVPVFDGGTNPVTAMALTAVDIWVVDAAAIRQSLLDHPEIARMMIEKLAKNLRGMVSLIEEMAFLPITPRLARLLSQTLVQSPETGILPRLTQDELAARLGTVREVVARSLKELERSGAIAIQRRRILIGDRSVLEQWADGGPQE